MPADNLDSIIESFNAFKPQLSKVETIIRDRLLDNSCKIGHFIEHLISAKGKMLRPSILFFSGNACGKICENHIKAAAVIEMVHTATLLHDDVIDNALLRRTNQTTNALWGNKNAILLGDYVLAKAFMLCSEIEDAHIAKKLAYTTQKICEGEITQNLFSRQQINEKQYLEIIEAKTAVLFALSASIGAYLANAEKNTVERFENFGNCFGIAFQIRDDLRDIISCQEQEGKTLGTDAIEDKWTLPIIHYYENCDINSMPTDIKKITLQQLTLRGSIEYTISKINYYCNIAKLSLKTLATDDTDLIDSR